MRTISETVALVFLAIAIVIVVARLVGKLFTKIGQPAVVGEIVAGIALGPTALGALPGNLDEALFPPDIRPYLSVLAQLGLVLFMFIVGLEVDLSFIRGRERVAASVSLASIAVPFALGALLAFQLYPNHDVVLVGETENVVTFAAFALFLGVAMSITAFPVLALILTERNMHRIPAGALSLACAAVDDILAWALLTVVVAVTVGDGYSGVLIILALSLAFVVVMFLAVRPLVARMVPRYEKDGRLTSDLFALVLIGILGSAFVTEEIGIHFIFGAFLFGVILPRQGPGASALRRDLLERLEQVSTTLLLPVFFVVTGLNVNLGAIGPTGLVELGLILLVAISGKFLGAFLAARLQRVPRRQSLALGVLMNTRGLTELVILNVALQLGVLDGEMFTLLVVMAVVTTMMTEPLLRLVYPRRLVERDIAEAERAALGESEAHTVLVVLDEQHRSEAFVAAACDLVGLERPARLVLASMVQRGPSLQVASGLGVELAALISTGDELRALASTAEARGLDVTVSSRFGADSFADLATLVDQVSAALVVVPESWAGLVGSSTLPGPRRPAMVVLRVPEPGADEVVASVPDVGVRINGDAAGRATLRVAAGAARARGGTLLVAAAEGWRAERRVASTVQALSRAGIPARPWEGDNQVGLRVVPSVSGEDGGSSATPQAWVHPGSEDADRDLAETIATIAVPVPEAEKPGRS
ncbi:MAG: cation:proton antiporter [Actinomycetota bacterium]|nr:cation:proton antiporter [Actinomycetota bacterium]